MRPVPTKSRRRPTGVALRTTRTTTVATSPYTNASGSPASPRQPTVAFTSAASIPVTDEDALIHWMMPIMNVEVPSVTMNESIRNATVRSPFTSPTTTPIARPTRIEGTSGTSIFAFRTAIAIAESDIVEAPDRSNSPAVSGKRNPSARMSSTDCDPRMFCRLPSVG